MEIYLQHGLQQKCAGLVSAGCLQHDDLSLNFVFNFRFLYYIYITYLIYTSFAIVLIVEPTKYLEYKIKDGLVSF